MVLFVLGDLQHHIGAAGRFSVTAEDQFLIVALAVDQADAFFGRRLAVKPQAPAVADAVTVLTDAETAMVGTTVGQINIKIAAIAVDKVFSHR